MGSIPALGKWLFGPFYTCKCWLFYINNYYCYIYKLCDSLVKGTKKRTRERVPSVSILIQDIRRVVRSALNPQTLMPLKIDNGACRSTYTGIFFIHYPFLRWYSPPPAPGAPPPNGRGPMIFLCPKRWIFSIFSSLATLAIYLRMDKTR